MLNFIAAIYSLCAKAFIGEQKYSWIHGILGFFADF